MKRTPDAWGTWRSTSKSPHVGGGGGGEGDGGGGEGGGSGVSGDEGDGGGGKGSGDEGGDEQMHCLSEEHEPELPSPET